MSTTASNSQESRWQIHVDQENKLLSATPNADVITAHMSRVMRRLQEMIRSKELEILYMTAPTEMLQQMHEVMVRELDKRMNT